MAFDSWQMKLIPTLDGWWRLGVVPGTRCIPRTCP